MCYMEQSSILVITSHHNIKAINPGTRSVLWEFTRDMEGKGLKPYGVCCDVDRRVHVADVVNKRLIVLDVGTGQFIHSLSDVGS